MTGAITNDCLISATAVAEIKQSLVITLVMLCFKYIAYTVPYMKLYRKKLLDLTLTLKIKYKLHLIFDVNVL